MHGALEGVSLREVWLGVADVRGVACRKGSHDVWLSHNECLITVFSTIFIITMLRITVSRQLDPHDKKVG